jgi:hypothetical protein
MSYEYDIFRSGAIYLTCKDELIVASQYGHTEEKMNTSVFSY